MSKMKPKLAIMVFLPCRLCYAVIFVDKVHFDLLTHFIHKTLNIMAIYWVNFFMNKCLKKATKNYFEEKIFNER